MMFNNITRVMFVALLIFNLPGLTSTQPLSCSVSEMPYTLYHMAKNDGHKKVALEYTMDLLQPHIWQMFKSYFTIAMYNASDESNIGNLMITLDSTIEVLDNMVDVVQSGSRSRSCDKWAVLNFKAMSPRITIRIEEKRLTLWEREGNAYRSVMSVYCDTIGPNLEDIRLTFFCTSPRGGICPEIRQCVPKLARLDKESFSASQIIIAIVGGCLAALITIYTVITLKRYYRNTPEHQEELTEIQVPVVNPTPPTYPIHAGQKVERDVVAEKQDEYHVE
ncbi:hypothetical protein Pcinc_034815 [Petrolisthes cinctipes]|uniref:Uncharacterized protein n=1 Tax=Petrolisthes cinctipes TaxID=88211 RepID=A0AAE1EP84_PETCI|nr:hypothetical protein Pcinc_034815 [Petrolisthes cinctipes]